MAIPTEMSKLASRSEPSLSVTHGNVNAGLLNQQENVTNNASLDRAHELVAQMPSSVRETLPAPIEEQPNDSQSVVNLIDDKSENSIGISGEESDTLASIGMSYETDYEPRNSNYDYFSKGWW
uniref:Uncharacterized protein n=1 Tax=Plectus sambesii TaxID=2011161 RepID=A0A914WI80_9BILA